MSKKSLAVAAVAASAVGLLAGPAPAHAAPCSQWRFDGDTRVNQSNGWTMAFTSTGPKAQGRASAVAFNDDGPVTMYGNISGGIEGYAVKFEVRWDGGEFGKYEGSADANGFVSGFTYDARTPSSTATWNITKALWCATPSGG